MKSFLTYNYVREMDGQTNLLVIIMVLTEKKFLIPLFMSILFSSYPRGMRKSKDRMNEDLITEYY